MEKELIEYLKNFVTPRRNQLFDEVLNNRTRYITLVLEDIYQSNNASAVLRTCDCFGIQDVHIIENRNEYQLNTEVTMGAEKWLNTYKYNSASNNSLIAVKTLKKQGYRIVASSPHKDDTLLPDFDLEKGKVAIFMGTELTGLSETILENADEYLKIPMFGFTESFNISVSAALILQNLTDKLKTSSIQWKITDEEKIITKLDWLRNTIKKVDLIEKKYFDNK
jgi:tRNA (guanosine-2'-O-)-methyltransferase